MRRATGIVGATVCMTVSAFLAGTTPASADDLDGNQFELVARTWTEHTNDVGRKGDSVGDSFTFTDRLFHGGERVGRDAGRCEVTRASRNAFGLHCWATLTLRGKGDLTVQGQVTFRRGDSSRPSLAITGGTGDFVGASGEFKLDDRRGEPTRYLIQLTP